MLRKYSIDSFTTSTRWRLPDLIEACRAARRNIPNQWGAPNRFCSTDMAPNNAEILIESTTPRNSWATGVRWYHSNVFLIPQDFCLQVAITWLFKHLNLDVVATKPSLAIYWSIQARLMFGPVHWSTSKSLVYQYSNVIQGCICIYRRTCICVIAASHESSSRAKKKVPGELHR